MSEFDLIIKEYKKKGKAFIVGNEVEEVERIPFSSPRANYPLYGGIPRGRLVEFYGEEGSAKTTTALDVLKNAQILYPNRKFILFDLEGTYDDYWATTLGVDVKNLIVFHPQDESGEDIFDMMQKLINTGEVELIILDSVPSLIPDQVNGETFETSDMAGIAKSLTRFIRAAIPLLAKYKTTLIAINQTRDNLDKYGSDKKTPGGKALKFYASVRFELSAGSYIDENRNALTRGAENPAGIQIKMKLVKTKICRPDRKVGSYSLNFLKGIDELGDTIDCAIEFGLIQKTGAWFQLVDLKTGEVKEGKINGVARVIEYYKSHPDEYDLLWQKTNELVIKQNKEQEE